MSNVLNIDDYGKCCTAETYILTADGNVVDIDYTDMEKNYEVIISKNVDKEHTLAPYIYKVQGRDDDKTYTLYNINRPIHELIGTHKERPTFYAINSPNVHATENNTFKIPISTKHEDIELEFDDNKYVLKFDDNGILNVYNKSDTKISNSVEIIEKYWITDSGFFCTNYSDRIRTCYIGKGNSYSYESLTNPIYRNFILLSELPRKIIYSNCRNDESVFRIKYNDNGTMLECHNDAYKSYNLCRCEGIGRRNNSESYSKTISVHPLLFDPFNYDYISIPFKYWVVERFVYDNTVISYERSIYRIDPGKVNILISDLNDNIEVPILV